MKPDPGPSKGRGRAPDFRSADDCSAALEPILSLARDVGSGEVPEDKHQRSTERLLLSLARQEALPARRPWGLMAAAALSLLVAALFVAWLRRPLGYTVEGGVLAEGGHVAPAGSAPVTVRFSDGSEVILRDGGSGRIADVTAHGARVVVERGRAEVHVVHGSSTEWLFEAGPCAISVTGTAFEVGWSPAADTLTVRVHEGSVLVRTPLATSGMPLVAGQQLVMRLSDGSVRIESAVRPEPSAQMSAGPAAAPPVSPAPNVSSAPSAGAAPSAGPETRPTWAALVAQGKYREVLADAEARGLDTSLSQGTLADLGALADAARYVGNNAVARRALLAQRARFAGSSQAVTAAFLLGRMAEGAEGPGAAIAFYDQYLAEAPGGPLASEALGRKMMALRASNPAAARDVAQAYLQRYPAGSYAAAASALVEPQKPAPQ